MDIIFFFFFLPLLLQNYKTVKDKFQFGREFKYMRRLGEGSYGYVFLATDPKKKFKFAVKMVSCAIEVSRKMKEHIACGLVEKLWTLDQW